MGKPAAPSREAFISRSTVFDASYHEHLARTPAIAQRLKEFILAKRKRPPDRFANDHKLKGRLADFSECHLAGDACLIYKDKNDVVHLLIICDHDAFRGPREKSLADRLHRL